MNRRHFSLAFLYGLGSLAIHRFPHQPMLKVNGPRITKNIHGLSEFGKDARGGVSRVAYSDADLKGREFVLNLMREAKLEVTIDAAGNLVGRRASSVPNLSPLLFG